MNKYNLQVGDKIRILSLWEVKQISKEGIIFKGKSYYFPWKHVNSALDDGTWSIEGRAPSTEYKVGDEVITHDLTIYVNENENFKVYNKAEGNRRVRPIQEIKGEYFQLEGDFTSWFKLSDLPPKTENMQEYKVGDVVITEGYHVEYDRKPLEITKIDKISHGTYCYFTPCESREDNFALSDIKRLATPEEIKQYNMKEKKIIGYKLIKPEYEKAAVLIIDYTENGHNPFSEYMLTSNGGFAQRLQYAGVLDKWFEPVYEPEKPKETILKLGDKKIEVKIGQKSIMADGKAVTRDEISELLGYMEGNLPVNFPWTVEFPRVTIGCTVFTRVDIDTILGTYDELNP